LRGWVAEEFPLNGHSRQDKVRLMRLNATTCRNMVGGGRLNTHNAAAAALAFSICLFFTIFPSQFSLEFSST